MTDNKLFDEPKLDEFKTESPLRAFSSFDMFGSYLIAKGFRPSLGHLTNYLDAMERKEGWRMVQVLEASSGVPTIIFRQAYGEVSIPKELGHHALWLRKALSDGLALGHHLKTVSLEWQEGALFSETDPKESRKIAMSAALAAGYGDGTMRIGDGTFHFKGLDPEKVMWNRAQWNGNPEEAMDRLKTVSFPALRRWLDAEKADDIHHYWRVASVASVLRLIEEFDMWDKVSLAEYITDDALYTAIGWTNEKARAACNTDIYAVMAGIVKEQPEVTSPVDVLESMAEDIAEELGLTVDRESFDAAREHVAEFVPMDLKATFLEDSAQVQFYRDNMPVDENDEPWPDDVPEEFREQAFRFVAERLGELSHNIEPRLTRYKKRFLNKKTAQVSHPRFDQQFLFTFGSTYSITAIREAIEAWKLIQELYTPQPPAPPSVRDVGDGFTRTVEHVVHRDSERILHEAKIEQMEPGTRVVDDPINPNHYNGRECADIGERLSANAYQILKYCWRLGKKDDPCQELGKALWYLDSEDTLLSIRGHGTQHFPNAHGIEDKKSFLEDRLENQSDFTKSVARMLWWGYGREKLASLKAEIADHKATLDCGHGLAL